MFFNLVLVFFDSPGCPGTHTLVDKAGRKLHLLSAGVKGVCFLSCLLLCFLNYIFVVCVLQIATVPRWGSEGSFQGFILPPLCGFWILRSGHQVWWQRGPFPSEPPNPSPYYFFLEQGQCLVTDMHYSIYLVVVLLLFVFVLFWFSPGDPVSDS